ncbi:transcriptional repressor CTCFL-like [Anopheles ziemanni]|uniref:transcriptional repressor CTCFL-like n=1 Tax=Anopheles coustani TaxID=139045 RepID=UPI00265935B0|nr:transcriptional repressor CTCFL-like [Anopheles coustani]XP_058178464.1 transcriptional repressor CTCFL-like [Anopheles ziemanni]
MNTRRSKPKSETLSRTNAASSRTVNKRGAQKTNNEDKTIPIKMTKADNAGDVEAESLSFTANNAEEDDEEQGCYFVDQKGNYYFQASEDAEPVLAAVGTEPFSAEGDENMKIEQDSVSYVLIMEDGENKSTIVADTADGGNLQPGEDEIYDFDDSDFIVEESAPSAKKPGRVKKEPAADGAMHMCNYCNYTTKKMFLLSRHLKSHSDDRPHKCSVCERGFKTMASLQNHVNTHTGTKPHRCKVCDNCFTTSGELIRHMRYKHTHERPHKCTECDYSSVELSKLKRHIRTHTGEKPFQCPHCTYASPDKFKLTRHMRIHTGEKPYSCDICFARFTQSNSLKAHKLIHQVGDKPVYQCELCPTTCGRKTDLRIHVQKLHTAEKPIKCKRCDSTFEDRYSYKMHVKTHEGERCFKCDFCPYASISARHLESHLLLHTNQKPFKCSECSQCFRQKQLLKRHINYYHNPDYVVPTPKAKTHVCPSCPRSFRHRGNLMRHMAMHDPESQLHEEQAALREGRQKKVQITLEEEMDDEEEEDEKAEGGDLVTVQDDDGQYVVLEVIQLQDKDGAVEKSSGMGTRKRGGARALNEASAPSTSGTSIVTRSGNATIQQQQVKMKQEHKDGNSLDNQSDFQGVEEEETDEEDEEEEEEEEEEIVIEQGDDHSESEFILSGDLEDTEMLMSTLQAPKQERYDLSSITVSQAEIEKNMSNCFGFSDDEDEDAKSTITLLT